MTKAIIITLLMLVFFYSLSYMQGDVPDQESPPEETTISLQCPIANGCNDL